MPELPDVPTQFDKPTEAKGLTENAATPFFKLPEETPESTSSMAAQAKSKHEQELLSIDGVEGVSVESDELGDDVIVVFIREESVAKILPNDLDGVPFRVEVTGEFDALGAEE